jgi:hypothetical protein
MCEHGAVSLVYPNSVNLHYRFLNVQLYVLNPRVLEQHRDSSTVVLHEVNSIRTRPLP